MSRWQSRAFNKVLERVMRHRLARCHDVLEMRQLVASIDRYGSLVEIPRGMRSSDTTLGDVSCTWVDMQLPEPESEQQPAKTELPAVAGLAASAITTRLTGSEPVSDDHAAEDRLADDKAPVILSFHGGGFCFSSPNTHNGFLARICQGTQARGLMVNYRLAPEHTFPAAHDDAFAVYRALLESGISSDDIIFLGDSAGGNLVLGTLYRAQLAGLPLPRGGVLLSPVCDMLMTGSSAFTKHQADPFFDLATLLLMRNTYLQQTPPQDPLASPLFAEFTPLPPLLFVVGSEEMLLDDSVRMAEKLQLIDSPVELLIGDGMPHVYPLFNQLKEAADAMDYIRNFISQLINPTTSQSLGSQPD